MKPITFSLKSHHTAFEQCARLKLQTSREYSEMCYTSDFLPMFVFQMSAVSSSLFLSSYLKACEKHHPHSVTPRSHGSWHDTMLKMNSCCLQHYFLWPNLSFHIAFAPQLKNKVIQSLGWDMILTINVFILTFRLLLQHCSRHHSPFYNCKNEGDVKKEESMQSRTWSFCV